MARITINFHTEQPVLVSSLQGDPNSTVTLPYLTGSMIRGAIIGAWIRQHGAIDLEKPNHQALFFDGTVKYLNGYIVHNHKRTIPTPLSWKQPKVLKQADTHTFQDQIYAGLNRQKDDSTVYSKTIADENPFMQLETDSVILKTVAKQLAIHTTRNRHKGRAIKATTNTNVLESGAVFQYEALSANQHFCSYILGPLEQLKEIKSVLEVLTHLWLGRSRSASYGKVSITVTLEKNVDYELEPQLPQHPSDTLVMLALSDIMLRDPYGNITLDIQKYLAEQLGIATPQNGIFMNNSTIIGGFNRTWGLPLPQTQAIERGSSWTLNVGSLTEEQRAKLHDLQRNGIGERQVEGYGRMLICLDHYTSYQLPVKKTAQPNPIVIDDDAINVWTRLMRQRFEQILLEEAGLLEIKGDISNSQLSQLWLAARQDLRSIEQDQPIKALQTYVADTQDQNSDITATAASQLNRSYVEKKITEYSHAPKSYKIPAWLQHILQDEYVKWNKKLFAVGSDEKHFEQKEALQKTINNNPELHKILQDLKKEYNLRLVMGVIKQTRRKRQHESQTEEPSND